jgi:hypothetical protein
MLGGFSLDSGLRFVDWLSDRIPTIGRRYLTVEAATGTPPTLTWNKRAALNLGRKRRSQHLAWRQDGIRFIPNRCLRTSV